jgi:sec-independent protein translocase protein TatB
MGGFGDYAFIGLLALLLFGPKKLPVLARQLGKLMADFRRASNEFRSQMEEELRIAEQADRQKQVAAIAVTTPPAPALEAPAEPTPPAAADPAPSAAEPAVAAAEPVPSPAPIATNGDLSILPPSTGLPVPNSSPSGAPDAATHESELETETLHG